MIGTPGVAAESNTIRIGTPGTHTTTHLTGDVQVDGQSLPDQIAALQAQLAALVGRFRFEACADGLTVADIATGLLWERKTGTVVGSGVICETAPGGCPDRHDVNNRYEWSNTGTAADGNAYTDFLFNLNAGSGFAGHTDWRLPVISELQSILVGSHVTTGPSHQVSTPRTPRWARIRRDSRAPARLLPASTHVRGNRRTHSASPLLVGV